MKQGRFSRTANKVAIRRAPHQLFDQPKVLDDPLAVPLIGVEAAEKLRSNRKERQHPISRAFRAFMAARSRYAEDELAKAIEERVASTLSSKPAWIPSPTATLMQLIYRGLRWTILLPKPGSASACRQQASHYQHP